MKLKTRDLLWKGIIEDLFADFLRFFFPRADEIFDMERNPEFLDKELEQLYPGNKIEHPKFVDKLVKLYKKDGVEEWLLIHIEVQGYRDKYFSRRMFTYFYRILDHLKKEVASLAIFSDNDRNYHPDTYEYKSLDTSNIFRFKTYKIKGQNEVELENSDNPFAIVILTVLISLQKGEKEPEDLLKLSVALVKRLLKKGFSMDKIEQILTFLKSYVDFERNELFIKFEEEIEVITNKKRTMGIKELVLQLAKEEGLEQGREQMKVSLVKNLLQKSNHSLQEIADFAEVSVDFIIEVKNNLI
ncbi:RpnC/YadD family protein [Flavitalea flava]